VSCFPFGFPFVPFPFTVCYPASMAGIPRHDWALYEDAHAIALTRVDREGDRQASLARWTDKMALRHKLRSAILALDGLRRGSTP